MTYIINPIWFYLMEISDGLKVFSGVVGGLVFILAISFLIEVLIGVYDWSNKKIKKWFINILIIGTVGVTLCICIPSSKTIEKMMIASFITEENIDKAKGEAKELVDYISEKIVEINQKENK